MAREARFARVVMRRSLVRNWNKPSRKKRDVGQRNAKLLKALNEKPPSRRSEKQKLDLLEAYRRSIFE